MTTTMTPEARVRAALRGEAVDRVPFCFWHHFQPDGSGERLADLTLAFFHQKFALDIIKIMPDLPYPAPALPVTQAENLSSLPRLNLDTPSFKEQLLCIKSIRRRVGNEYPLILTLFSPMTTILQLMGKELAIAEARRLPDAIEEGQDIISTNQRALIEAALDAGLSGIFFSCMGATGADFTREEYLRLARPYDLASLSSAHYGWLNTVHIHAEPQQTEDQIYFDLFTDYPVQVLSWSDRLTGPSLSEAHTLTDKCLMGGLWERGPLIHGSATELENEILSAVAQTKGRHLILANGCSIPDDSSEVWLHKARELVDSLDEHRHA